MFHGDVVRRCTRKSPFPKSEEACMALLSRGTFRLGGRLLPFDLSGRVSGFFLLGVDEKESSCKNNKCS